MYSSEGWQYWCSVRLRVEGDEVILETQTQHCSVLLSVTQSTFFISIFLSIKSHPLVCSLLSVVLVMPSITSSLSHSLTLSLSHTHTLTHTHTHTSTYTLTHIHTQSVIAVHISMRLDPQWLYSYISHTIKLSNRQSN